MKKLSTRTLIAGVFLAGFTMSCTNLDEQLFDKVTGNSFLTSPAAYTSALGAAYTPLYAYGSHNTWWSVNSISSDEMMIPQRGQDWYDGGQWLRAKTHQFSSRDEGVSNAWANLYSAISNCNRLIETFEPLATDLSKATVAELKALRALYYYILMDMFGNVPLSLKFVGADPAPKNNSRAEVYAFIESELTTNVPLLTKVVDISTYGRMNYYVGQTLLAKLYLNAGVYINSVQWDKAKTACDEVINGGKYLLEGDYFANFKSDNANSKENIFVVPYDAVYANGFNLDQMTLHYESQKTFNLQQQPWNGYCAATDFFNSYQDIDKRKGAGPQPGNFLYGPQYSSTGARLVDSGSEANDPDGPNMTFTPDINMLEPAALRQAGARLGKWEFKIGGSPNMDNDWAIFRYADVLLMKAETLANLNGYADATALALVNQIRTRAGVPVYTTLTADNLLAERGREMAFEGWRRGDLIRFGKFNGAWQFHTADGDTHVNLLPIPYAQKNSNPNLVQNPGYTD